MSTRRTRVFQKSATYSVLPSGVMTRPSVLLKRAAEPTPSANDIECWPTNVVTACVAMTIWRIWRQPKSAMYSFVWSFEMAMPRGRSNCAAVPMPLESPRVEPATVVTVPRNKPLTMTLRMRP